jgi:hypothetical protein
LPEDCNEENEIAINRNFRLLPLYAGAISSLKPRNSNSAIGSGPNQTNLNIFQENIVFQEKKVFIISFPREVFLP